MRLCALTRRTAFSSRRRLFIPSARRDCETAHCIRTFHPLSAVPSAGSPALLCCGAASLIRANRLRLCTLIRRTAFSSRRRLFIPSARRDCETAHCIRTFHPLSAVPSAGSPALLCCGAASLIRANRLRLCTLIRRTAFSSRRRRRITKNPP